MDPEFIVAEVSKNWPDPRPDPPYLCHLFEDIIGANWCRGYRLHSFSLHRMMAGPGEMNETIVAVFQKEGRPGE